MSQARRSSVAATAQLEGWRLPVDAALQPVLVVDVELRVGAASRAAQRLLVLPEAGRPLREAVALRDLAADWSDSPFARAVATGEPQRAMLDLTTAGLTLDVVASPLFGPTGVIGAVVFLTSVRGW